MIRAALLTMLLTMGVAKAGYFVGNGGGGFRLGNELRFFDFHVLNILPSAEALVRATPDFVFDRALGREVESKLGLPIPQELLLRKLHQVEKNYPYTARRILRNLRTGRLWKTMSLRSRTIEYRDAERLRRVEGTFELIALTHGDHIYVDPARFRDLSPMDQVGLLFHETLQWKVRDLFTQDGIRYVVFRNACLFDASVSHPDFEPCPDLLAAEDDLLRRGGLDGEER